MSVHTKERTRSEQRVKDSFGTEERFGDFDTTRNDDLANILR